MPKILTDYSKLVIYRIFLDDFIYIGSTTNFTKRKNRHKSNCNDTSYTEIKLYKFINEYGGWDNFKMLEIEKFPCADKNEARTREQYWIDYYNSQLNSRKAISTPNQYYLENKDNIAEYHKNHYQKNKETILEYQKKYNSLNKEKKAETSREYYEKNKECILTRQKTNYENNKEEILQKQKLYAEKNKETIKEKKKNYGLKKNTCECGSIFRIADKSKHYKTNKHQQFINTNQNIS
jgi:hypothetical protein